MKWTSCLVLSAKLLPSCPTLCDPMDCNPPSSSVLGIFQARMLEMASRLPFPSIGDFPNPGIESASLSFFLIDVLIIIKSYISSVHLLSCVWLFATPWTAACQASLSITNSWSLLKLMSIESVMPSTHLILCHPLLLLHPIPPSIRVFPNESTPCIRWPKYWSFSFSISPSNEHPGKDNTNNGWFMLMYDRNQTNIVNQSIKNK